MSIVVMYLASQFLPTNKKNPSMKILPPSSSRLRGICLFAAFASLVLPAFGANVDWNGTTTGNWAVGGNWVGGNPPVDNTTTDDAYFTGTGDYTVSLTANRSVRRFYVTGTANPIFDFGIYTLTAPSLGSINGGNASLVSGTISTIWYQGYRNSGSTFTISGSNAAVTTSTSLVGYGDTAALNGNSNTLIVQNGGRFTGSSTSSLGVLTSAAGTDVTANQNKIEVTGAGSTFEITSVGGINIGFINGGTNTGRQASNNEVVINNGGEFITQLMYVGRLAASTVGVSTGNSVTIGGTGTGSVLNLQPSVSASALHIGFGGATNNIVRVNAGGAIEANGTNLRVYSSTGNVLRVFGGEIKDAGTILVEGKMFLGAGGSVTANQITVTASGRFGDKSDAATAGFTSGTLVLGAMTYNPAVMFSVGDNSGSTPAIYNMAGGVHSFGGGITIEESEGRLTGNGTIQGIGGGNTTLTVNGMLAPGNSVGTINLTGNLVSGANAVFNFEIASLSDFDQLNITGTAAFDGTLNLTLLNGYMPNVGNSFALFEFASSSGSFALNLAALDAGKLWDTSQLYSHGLLSVVAIPEPSTAILLAVAGLTGWLRKRNRR